jgi:hypothetical protein
MKPDDRDKNTGPLSLSISEDMKNSVSVNEYFIVLQLKIFCNIKA